MSKVAIELRKSTSRGHADHGWLNTYHTFNFASYYDPKAAGLNYLRVLNEDRVSGGRGFGRHPHANFEIFSYVVSGSLLHEDSMGNKEIIKRGDVQFTSAGRGIAHSEFNASKTDLVHFLQMWVEPNQKGLTPSYKTKRFEDKEKEGKLCLIVGPKGDHEGIVINQDIKVFASILNKGTQVSYTVLAGRDVYIHLIQDVIGYNKEAKKTKISVNETLLTAGDGATIRGSPSLEAKDSSSISTSLSSSSASTITPSSITITITGVSDEKAEFLLFDVLQKPKSTSSYDDDEWD